MKTILVPTDFSAESKNAIDVGVGLAKQFGSKLVILHVIDSVDEGSFNVEGEAVASSSWADRLFNMKLIEKAKREISKIESGLAGSGAKFKTLLRMGDAYHGMIAVINEQSPDLVVMGTKGSSGFEELFVGSNTEKMVRRSGCPVLAVGKKSGNAFKNIVWATSLHQEDLVMPEVLKNIIQKLNPVVHLVRINTPALFISDERAKEKLQSFADRLKLKNYTLNVYNDYNEEDGIVRFADSINADAIAMATHRRTGLAHLLSGSVAENVVNHAKRLVLTFPVARNI